MHGMIPADRQARYDQRGLTLRHDRSGRECVALDAIGLLDVQPVPVESDARATLATFRGRRPEALGDVGLAAPGGVLQRDDKATRGCRLVAVVTAAPAV